VEGCRETRWMLPVRIGRFFRRREGPRDENKDPDGVNDHSVTAVVRLIGLPNSRVCLTRVSASASNAGLGDFD